MYYTTNQRKDTRGLAIKTKTFLVSDQTIYPLHIHYITYITLFII
ncbi:hypothetical protein VPHK120G1_0013 [Vibrio phage K120 g1]